MELGTPSASEVESSPNRGGRAELPLAILALAAILGLFFSEFLVTNKVLSASDVLFNVSPWDSLAPDGFSRPQAKNLGETLLQIAPWRDLVASEFKRGKIPLWNPYSFAGTPLLANFQAAAFDPVQSLNLFLAPPTGRLYGALFRLLASGVFAFLLATRLQLRFFSSLLLAVGWMLNGWVMAWLLWPLGPAMTYLPAVLFFTFELARKKTASPVVGLTLTICLLLLTGHPETTLFVLCFSGLVACFLSLSRLPAPERSRARVMRVLGGYALACVLAALICSIQIVPFLEYLKESASYVMRSNREIRLSSTVPYRYRLPLFLVPKIFGTVYDDNLWGPWGYNGMMAYPTAVALFLLPLGFCRRRTRGIAWLFLIVGVLMVLFAIRAPFFVWLIHSIPGFQLAATSRLQVFWIFCVVLLGAFGWDFLERKVLIDRRWLPLGLWVWLGALLAVICVSLAIVLPLVTETAQRDYALREAGIAIGLLLFVPAIVVLRRLIPVPLVVLRVALLSIVVGDLARVALPGLSATDPEQYYPPLRVVERLRQTDGSVYRVAPAGRNIFIGNSCATYGLMEVRGNDALTIRGYDELFRRLDKTQLAKKRLRPDQHVYVEKYLRTGDEQLLDSFDNPFFALRMRVRYERAMSAGEDPLTLLDPEEGPKTRVLELLSVGSPLLDLLNAKYVLIPRGTARSRIAGLSDEDRFVHLFDEECQVFENKTVGPRAFLVDRVRIARDDEEALDILDRGDVDLRTTAVVVGTNPLGTGSEPAEPAESAPSNLGAVEIASYDTQEVVLNVEVDVDRALLVLADAFFPGWEATVDGQPTEIVRTDLILRGVVVGRGRHEIRFVYRPASFVLGASMSGLGVALLILSTWIWRRFARRSGRNGGEVE